MQSTHLVFAHTQRAETSSFLNQQSARSVPRLGQPSSLFEAYLIDHTRMQVEVELPEVAHVEEEGAQVVAVERAVTRKLAL